MYKTTAFLSPFPSGAIMQYWHYQLGQTPQPGKCNVVVAYQSERDGDLREAETVEMDYKTARRTPSSDMFRYQFHQAYELQHPQARLKSPFCLYTKYH